MTKQTLNKAIEKLASMVSDLTVEQIRKDLQANNPVRWYMVEEAAKSI
jgi:flagellar motor switch protein FliG|tara:strand:+ start:1497 stop:1640 length:144 start_codon:yes stop_codon:yes gene_type:complete